jgi:phosphatidylglycerophosphate synthase
MKDDAHYEYRFEDHSIVLRLLERPVFGPLVRALPRGITPNQITIAGQLAAAAAFALAVSGRTGSIAGLLLLAALSLCYTVADAIDGAFARHSKQTSRLGELLDHWLDALSVPLLVLSFGLALPADPRLVFAAALVTSFLHFATFLHGFRLGFVHLGAIGMVEGTVVGAGVCIAATFTGPEIFARPVVAGLSSASLLLIALVGGGGLALWSMRGLIHHLRDFVFLGVLFAAAAAWFAGGQLSAALAGGLVIAVGSRLEGQVIRARLLREPLALGDPLLLVLVLGGTVASLALHLDGRTQGAIAALVLGYALWREARAFARTVTALLAPAPVSSP